MVGEYSVTVTTKKDVINFSLRRKYTLLRGDSGTGKSILFFYLRMKEMRKDYPVKVDSKIPVVTIQGKESFTKLGKCIIVMDEDTIEYYKSLDNLKTFKKLSETMDSYFLLISRLDIPSLPYSVLEVFSLTSIGVRGKVTHDFKQVYTWEVKDKISPDCIITEDSGSGFQFMSSVSKCSVISAKGKSNLPRVLNKAILKGYCNIFILADGAALGSEMTELSRTILDSDANVSLYAPESFEFILLSSRIFQKYDIRSNLNETYNYADTKKFLSWERYFTFLIQELSKRFGVKTAVYSKSKLSGFYLSGKNKEYILEVIEELDIC